MATLQEVRAEIARRQQPQQSKVGGVGDFAANVVNNAVGGAEALKDIFTGNYETPFTPNYNSPANNALSDKLFPQGSTGGITDFIGNITNTQPNDWANALLEKFSSNPAGKAAAAIGGLTPVGAIAGSAWQTFASPTIQKLTGAGQGTVDALALLGGAMLGARQLSKGSPVAKPNRAELKTSAQLKKMGVSSDDVINTMAEARKQGVDLTLPEAATKVVETRTGQPMAMKNNLITKQRTISESPLPASETINQATFGRQSIITDQLQKLGQNISDDARKASDPIYQQLENVKVKGIKFENPLIKSAITEISKNKELKNLVVGKPRDSFGYLNEVKKYLDTKAQNYYNKTSGSQNTQLGDKYSKAALELRTKLDKATGGLYETARNKSQPGIVARNQILDPLTGSDSIATIKNQIFGSPEKRAELKRGIGAENYQKVSGLMATLERIQKSAVTGSDTNSKLAARAEIEGALSTVGDVATGGKLAGIRSGINYLVGKYNEKNWQELANLYTQKDLTLLQKRLANAEKKATNTIPDIINDFFQSKLPESAFIQKPLDAVTSVAKGAMGAVEKGYPLSAVNSNAAEQVQEVQEPQYNLDEIRAEIQRRQPKPDVSKIPPISIQKLRGDPSLAPDFDAMYGQGAAEQFLQPVDLSKIPVTSIKKLQEDPSLAPYFDEKYGAGASKNFLKEDQSANETIDAITNAAKTTNAPLELMLKFAKAESSLNPTAEAKTSSAKGLYQITKPTWLSLVSKYGKDHGITVQDIFKPEANAIMAGKLIQENKKALSDAFERTPSDGELYIAHFMGADSAKKLIKAAPYEVAFKMFPKEAKSNPDIFFNGNNPRTVAEVYQLLTSKV